MRNGPNSFLKMEEVGDLSARKERKGSEEMEEEKGGVRPQLREREAPRVRRGKKERNSPKREEGDLWPGRNKKESLCCQVSSFIFSGQGKERTGGARSSMKGKKKRREDLLCLLPGERAAKKRRIFEKGKLELDEIRSEDFPFFCRSCPQKGNSLTTRGGGFVDGKAKIIIKKRITAITGRRFLPK